MNDTKKQESEELLYLVTLARIRGAASYLEDAVEDHFATMAAGVIDDGTVAQVRLLRYVHGSDWVKRLLERG